VHHDLATKGSAPRFKGSMKQGEEFDVGTIEDPERFGSARGDSG
jgi:hypothetical protein